MIDPTAYDLNVVVVNGVPSPGRATITGAAIPWNYDVKEGYGQSGAFVVFKGRGIAKFTLTIELWERAHFVAWPLFAKLLEPPKPGLKLVVSMSHPLLSAQDIKAVAVESLGAPERQSNGIWRITIACIEWRPQAPALVKARGAIPAVKGKPIPPKTEADIALVQAKEDFIEKRDAARR